MPSCTRSATAPESPRDDHRSRIPPTEEPIAELEQAGCRGGGRGRRAGEGGVPGVARRRARRPGAAPAARRDAGRGERRGAGADRVAERRQADRRRARRDRDGRAGLPLLRRRGRQARRRDDPRRRRRRRHVPRAARRRRAHRSLELPGEHRQLEARAGARMRQHRRPEAGRADAALGDPARRAVSRGGNPGRRRQRPRRQGLGRRAAPDRAPGRREDRLHRLDRGRAARDAGRRRDDQARHARARRQVRQRDLRGRRPREGGCRGAVLGLRQRGPGLLRALAHPRPDARSTTGSSSCSSTRRAA